MPKCLLITGEYDILKDEHIAFAKRLQDSGVKVEIKFYEKMVHGFHMIYRVIPTEVELEFEDIKSFILD